MGPLPHPAILERYEQILPGMADRVLAMAERQSEHRMALESKALADETRRSYAGMACGLIVALAGFGSGILIALHGGSVQGSVVSSLSLVSLVGSFIYGTERRRQERQERAHRMTEQDNRRARR